MHFSKPCSGASHFHGNIYILYCDAHVIARSASSIELWRLRDSLLLSQSSREGFESSLSVICDTLRVCFAGQVAKSANKMGVFACIPRDLTHLRTSLHTNMSNTHERWWHRLRHNSLCDPTRRCCVLPLTNARNTKDTERVLGGGGGGACMEGEYMYIALLQYSLQD